MQKTMMFLLGVVGLAATAFAADPWCIGTWKQNMTKSKFTPGPGPKEVTVVVQEKGDVCDIMVKGTDGKGAPISVHEIAPKDGNGELKFLEGGPPASAGLTLTSKRVDDHTRETLTMAGGKQVSNGRMVMSKDGKTLRITEKGVNEQGKPFEENSVYERR